MKDVPGYASGQLATFCAFLGAACYALSGESGWLAFAGAGAFFGLMSLAIRLCPPEEKPPLSRGDLRELLGSPGDGAATADGYRTEVRHSSDRG
jgi:hypothetical protein